MSCNSGAGMRCRRMAIVRRRVGVSVCVRGMLRLLPRSCLKNVPRPSPFVESSFRFSRLVSTARWVCKLSKRL